MKSSGSNLSGYADLGRVWILVVLMLAVGCAGGATEDSTAASRVSPAPSGPEGIAAVVGGREITDSQVEGMARGAIIKAELDVFHAKEQGLNQIIQDTLFELEAEADGISVEELLNREVFSQVSDPTQVEVAAFYEENKARIQQSLEEIAPQIHGHLANQRRMEAMTSYLAGLQEKHGVETFLEPVRIPVEADGFPSKGPADAPVTLVEFSDFECPYCGRVNPTLDRLEENYGDRLRIVFRQFPLNGIHPNAQKAAEASLCANDQDRFWDLHDTMFKEQRSLGVEQLKEKAARLGLDTDSFNECLESGRHAEAVEADLKAGSEAGVTGTPALFINGRFLSGAQPYETLAEIIESELGRAGR